MKFDWLEDFVALSDEGSFSRTASRRNVAQPALSRRIRSLEDWAGATLFDRHNHPITLTEEGQLFQPYVQEALSAISIGRNKLRNSAQEDRVLKFSSTHTISIQFFPEWFRGIQSNFEGVGISLQSNHLDRCAEDLESGACHFMLCYSDGSGALGFNESAFESKSIGKDEIVPISLANEDGTPKFKLPGTARKPNPLLEYSQASALSRMVESLLVRKRETSRIRKQSESPAADNLLSLASQGLGIAWIPASRVKVASDLTQLTPAGDASWNVQVDIRIFKSRGSLPRLAAQFWDLI